MAEPVAASGATERPAAVWLILALKALAVVGVLQSAVVLPDMTAQLPAALRSMVEHNPWWSWWVTGLLALADLFGAITLLMLSRVAVYIFASVWVLHFGAALLLFALQSPTGLVRWLWLSALVVGYGLSFAVVGYAWWLCRRGVLR